MKVEVTSLYTFVVVFLSLINLSRPHCSTVYGVHQPCSFLPAPPGKTPPCAKPGMTFCEHPDNYPAPRIHYLVNKWRFDHSTILTDESKDDFRSYFYPPPTYKYPIGGNTLRDSYFPNPDPEPIDIPRPTSNAFDVSISSGYIPPSLNFTHFSGYPERRRQPSGTQFLNYKYSNNIPPSSAASHYSPSHTNQMASFDVNNRIWNSRNLLLNRKKRSDLVRQKIRQLNYESSNNETSSRVRTKRQSALVGQPLCASRSNYIMPRAALNNKGNWMYVVNMPEFDNRYSQLVKSESCATQTCSGLCGLPPGYTSRCEQKYVQKRLVALEGSGNDLYTDVFWFPSCCVCTISNPT